MIQNKKIAIVLGGALVCGLLLQSAFAENQVAEGQAERLEVVTTAEQVPAVVINQEAESTKQAVATPEALPVVEASELNLQIGESSPGFKLEGDVLGYTPANGEVRVADIVLNCANQTEFVAKLVPGAEATDGFKVFFIDPNREELLYTAQGTITQDVNLSLKGVDHLRILVMGDNAVVPFEVTDIEIRE